MYQPYENNWILVVSKGIEGKDSQQPNTRILVEPKLEIYNTI